MSVYPQQSRSLPRIRPLLPTPESSRGSGENSASHAECTVHHSFRGGRSCGNAAPEAEGCSSLWGTGFRAVDSDASTSSPGLLVAFLSSTLQPVPSLPHQGAGRIRDSPSVAPQVFVLLACCFQRRMLVAFWEPGLPEQLRWRHFRAAQSGVLLPFYPPLWV